MKLLQLLLLVLVGLFIRRLYRTLTSRPVRPRPGAGARPAEPGPGGLQDRTQQDISDADFEEIP